MEGFEGLVANTPLRTKWTEVLLLGLLQKPVLLLLSKINPKQQKNGKGWLFTLHIHPHSMEFILSSIETPDILNMISGTGTAITPMPTSRSCQDVSSEVEMPTSNSVTVQFFFLVFCGAWFWESERENSTLCLSLCLSASLPLSLCLCFCLSLNLKFSDIRCGLWKYT